MLTVVTTVALEVNKGSWLGAGVLILEGESLCIVFAASSPIVPISEIGEVLEASATGADVELVPKGCPKLHALLELERQSALPAVSLSPNSGDCLPAFEGDAGLHSPGSILHLPGEASILLFKVCARPVAIAAPSRFNLSSEVFLCLAELERDAVESDGLILGDIGALVVGCR